MRRNKLKLNSNNKMDIDLNLMNSVLQYIIGENEYVCRLCLNPVETKNVSLDDTVELKRHFIHEEVTYDQMLSDLDLQQEASLPQLMCRDCATTIKNAYLFKRLIPYCTKIWTEILAKVVNTVEQTRTVSEGVKTIFFLVNEKKDLMLTSRTNTRDKKQGLLKLKHLLKCKKQSVKVKKISSALLCKDCGETFESKTHLNRHNAKVHSEVRYACSMCPKVAASQTQLEGHIIRMHHPKKYKCPKCDKMFSTEKLVAYHDQSYHKAVICKLCFVQFPSKRELRSHLDKHEVQNCPKCGKLFYSRQTFKVHEKICGDSRHKQPKFFCDICNKGYAYKSGIRSHLKIDHGFGVNMHHCKWCSKKFDAASKLKMHSVVHTRERNFRCDHCGSKFVTQAALVYHVRLHTGERPFPCDICGERFLSASRRMEHLRRKHIGPTKECPICHVKFILTHQLKKHIQRHYNPHSKLFVRDLIVIMKET